MRRLPFPGLSHLALAVALSGLAPAARAQDAPAPASSTSSVEMGAMPDMDMAGMPGMSMPAPAATTPPASSTTAAPPPPHGTTNRMLGREHNSVQGMDHGSSRGMDRGSMQDGDHSSMHGMNHGSTQDMDMGPMQGGNPPADARDPNYSAGVGHGPYQGIHKAMDDNASIAKVLVDQWEAFHGKDGSGQQWEMQGYYGNDYDKLWLRTEGERSGGKLEQGDIEAFWNHAIATFWNTQLGVRSDAGAGPDRQWAAFGIEGLAPYWFELEATGYVDPTGRTAARFRAEYELFFTQRLILQPEFEANAYGRDDPARRLGSGLSDASIGLRLRYAFHRQFAPYVGVVWMRRFGGTADFARRGGHGLFDRQWVAGLRIWF